jgi:AcrR family transcriptional regulator
MRPDHRVEVARERRDRMRARLLDATLKVWVSEGGSSEAVVIRDVVEAAGVSRATFYKHFSSLDEAGAALGSRLSDEMVGELDPVQGRLTDPTLRASVGIQIFLWRSVHDRVWGRFVSRSRHVVNDNSKYIRQVGQSLLTGLERKQFAFSRLDVTLAFNNGALKEGIAALSDGVDDPKAFIRELTTMMLVGFAIDPERARRAVDEGGQELQRLAPSFYPWWPNA